MTHASTMRVPKTITLWCAGAVFVLPVALRPDSYHNIQGFYGGRAAALGGAYAAVSDDPTGAYYNPAGLGFMDRDYVTVSASNYRSTSKAYENVFGPGQGYVRASESYLPNFLGAFSRRRDSTIGFSIVSQGSDNFDQGDQVAGPLGLPSVSGYRNEYTEDNTHILLGPGGGMKLGRGFSIGASLYYLYDSTRVTSSQLVMFNSGSYRRVTVQDRRRTLGFEPVVGAQYELGETVIVGLSVRQVMVTAESRTQSGVDAPVGSSTSDTVSVSLNTDAGSGSIRGRSVILGSPTRGSIPETREVRYGTAWFPSRRTLLTADVIWTSGYRLKQDRTQIDLTNKITYLNDEEVAELHREPTLNLAAGVEQYLTDRLFVAGGFFTNKSNHAERSWLDSAAAASGRNTNNGSTFQNGNIVVPTRGGYLAYRIPFFADTERFESVRNQGLSLGLGWSDEKSSISLTLIREWGRGSAQIDSSQPAAPLRYESRGAMIVAGTRY